MSRNRELSLPPASVDESPARCAYCEAPLKTAPAETATSSLPRRQYCCYGCRVLGESAHQRVDVAPAEASPWLRIIFGAMLAIQAALLGTALNLTPPSPETRWLLHAVLIVSSLAALVLLGRPLVVAAWEELRQRRITIELLFLSGVVGAFGASLVSTFTGHGSVYYEIVAVLVTIYAVGKTLGARSRARALAETRHLQRTFETCQKVAPDGTLVATPVAEIAVGDEVQVLAGQPIPIDGTIVEGRAFVCETPLTGEPFPVVRQAGDLVFAGSYAEDAALRLRAAAPGRQRRLDALLRALDDARERPCRLQQQADRIVQWFLPIVLAVAAGTFAWWTWRAHWSDGLFNALSVLLVACPCAMGLATPVALWSGLAALAARGVVVRSGDVLERLASLDHLVFDKTGTLSEEQCSLIDLAMKGGAKERQDLLIQLQAVQNTCPHPVARAFHTGALESPSAACRVRSFKTVPGRGLEAWVETARGTEHHLRIGQRELVGNLRGEAELLAGLSRSASDYLVYLERDGELAGIAAVRERIRDSAGAAMRSLAAQGISCGVMSGDHPERTRQVLVSNLQDAGLRIEGGLTPEAKVQQVAALRAAGRRVGFVGDGVNDAAAIREATAGLAMAHGAGVSTQGADAVIYGGDLRVVPWALALCRQVSQSIRSNLIFAATYNFIGIVLAATGMLHPVAAALLMVVSSFTVSWRALRSNEVPDDCCAQPAPVPTRQPLAESRLQPQFSRLQKINAALLMLQAPFLVYLGQLNFAEAAVVAAMLGALGWAAWRFNTRNLEWARVAHMTFAMLGVSNWGMVLGWWADAGFVPVHLAGPCCAPFAGSLFGFAQMPWMNLGMLLFGLPPMILNPAGSWPGLNRFALGLLSAAGMLLGMSFGETLALQWFAQLVPNLFLLSLAGMTVGMLLGMFLCCEFGRALSLATQRLRRSF